MSLPRRYHWEFGYDELVYIGLLVISRWCDNCLHHSVLMGISCDNRLRHSVLIGRWCDNRLHHSVLIGKWCDSCLHHSILMGISCDNCLHHSVVMGISCDNRLYHLKHTWKAPEESKSFHSKGRFGPINLVYPLRRFIELSVPNL
jgi:hypothetical protein